jgi:hypothetical protein
MKKSSQFENILDECLERLIKGETVEQCLESYPEQALELEPLLRTAQATREAAAITPRADFKARARYEFRSALHAEVSHKTRSLPALRRGWVVALMVIGILLVSGGGTALAAGNSMPDSPLYRVKLATERVQLALTPSALGKAQLCAALADRRVAEIIYLANKGDAQQVEDATQRLDERLTTLVELVSVEGVETVPVAETPRMLTEEPAMAPPAPSSQAETVPVSPTAPAAVPAPAPTPPPPTVNTPLPEEEVDEGAEGAPAGGNNRLGLRMMLASYLESNPDALRTALEKAPPAVKSALHQAIIVSENGYREALAAMD